MLVGDECDTCRFAFKYDAEKSVGITLGIPFLEEAFVEGLLGEIPFVDKTSVIMTPPKIVLEN